MLGPSLDIIGCHCLTDNLTDNRIVGYFCGFCLKSECDIFFYLLTLYKSYHIYNDTANAHH
jgi:hypothetical protein